MSDENEKIAPEAKSEETSQELTDEALEEVAGGVAGLAVAIPGVTGTASLTSRETGTCVSTG